MKMYWKGRKQKIVSFRLADLINEVSEIAELTPYQTRVAIATILSEVVQTIRQKETVAIRGFGRFKIVWSAEGSVIPRTPWVHFRPYFRLDP